MRFNSARQMIFEAYLFHRGDSPIASLFDTAQRLEKAAGKQAGVRTRQLTAQYKAALRALEFAKRDGIGIDKAARQVRVVEKQLSSIRLALADSSRSSNEGYIRDNDWNIVSGMEAGQVMSAVESLPRYLQAFALYCHGPLERREREALAEMVQRHLHHELIASGEKVPGQGKSALPGAEKLEQLYWLCRAGVYHYSEIVAGRHGLATPRSIQSWVYDECGCLIDVHRWSREGRACWGATWSQVLVTLDRWEADALAPVAALDCRAAA